MSKIVLDYLMNNTAFEVKNSFIDNILELSEFYETIPEEIQEAYNNLSEYDLWEIIRKLAVEGKRRTK